MSYKKEKGNYKNYNRTANVHHLTRIITYLSELAEEGVTRSTIDRSCGIGGAIIEAMNFLSNHKIIFVLGNGATKKYVLNPIFKHGMPIQIENENKKRRYGKNQYKEGEGR